MAIGRVGTRAAFSALSQRGVRSRAGVVRLTWLPAEPGDESTTPPVRVAYAIGRPVGTAVVRNRLRRRLRAAMAELAPESGTYL
ncbi:MAG: ribonuclease P protein component, partial [Acidimicrobiia bacterium]|nr:ribonuclease P protein component [Acidimicrobiia bacterium]